MYLKMQSVRENYSLLCPPAPYPKPAETYEKTPQATKSMALGCPKRFHDLFPKPNSCIQTVAPTQQNIHSCFTIRSDGPKTIKNIDP